MTLLIRDAVERPSHRYIKVKGLRRRKTHVLLQEAKWVVVVLLVAPVGKLHGLLVVLRDLDRLLLLHRLLIDARDALDWLFEESEWERRHRCLLLLPQLRLEVHDPLLQ